MSIIAAITITASYLLIGLLLAFGVATYGKAKDWHEDNIFMGSIASTLFWPVIPLLVLGVFIFRRLDDLSTMAARKFK